MSDKPLTEVLDATRIIARLQREAESEVRHLRQIKTWALEQQPVHAEDAVTLRASFPPLTEVRAPGWYAYREALVSGATGLVESVDWNEYAGSWQALVRFDAMWSVHEWGRGDLRRYSSGGAFSISVEHLRPRSPDDITPTFPAGTEIVENR